MSWLTPPITPQEVRQAFIELDENNVPAVEILTPAITRAENAVRVLAVRYGWADDAATAAHLFMHDMVLHWTMAEVYDDLWGHATFQDQANSVAKAKRKYVLEMLQTLEKSPELTPSSSGSRVASNAALANPVFDMGREGGWVEPGADRVSYDDDINRVP